MTLILRSSQQEFCCDGLGGNMHTMDERMDTEEAMLSKVRRSQEQVTGRTHSHLQGQGQRQGKTRITVPKVSTRDCTYRNC